LCPLMLTFTAFNRTQELLCKACCLCEVHFHPGSLSDQSQGRLASLANLCLLLADSSACSASRSMTGACFAFDPAAGMAAWSSAAKQGGQKRICKAASSHMMKKNQ
jgi:hypothetical protein